MGIKVLFVYPNSYGMNMLPPAIALLSAVLKKEGHSVELFDTTYYKPDLGTDSDGTKVERLNVLPFGSGGFTPEIKADWRDDFKDQVHSFSPDLIAMSSENPELFTASKIARNVAPISPKLFGFLNTFFSIMARPQTALIRTSLSKHRIREGDWGIMGLFVGLNQICLRTSKLTSK